MKPARVFAGLTASTILTASLALTPQAVADPTTPTSGDDTGTAPTSPYNYAAIGDSATVAGSWFHPEKNLCGRNKKDYPAITASGTGLQLNEAACYNATSKNFQWTQPAGFGNSPNSPQIKAINKKTRLITIQLGLRDIVGAGPTSLFSKCAASWGKQYASMASGKLTELTGGPCRDRYEKSTLEKFDGLESHLAAYTPQRKPTPAGMLLLLPSVICPSSTAQIHVGTALLFPHEIAISTIRSTINLTALSARQPAQPVFTLWLYQRTLLFVPLVVPLACASPRLVVYPRPPTPWGPPLTAKPTLPPPLSKCGKTGRAHTLPSSP